MSFSDFKDDKSRFDSWRQYLTEGVERLDEQNYADAARADPRIGGTQQPKQKELKDTDGEKARAQVQQKHDQEEKQKQRALEWGQYSELVKTRHPKHHDQLRKAFIGGGGKAFGKLLDQIKAQQSQPQQKQARRSVSDEKVKGSAAQSQNQRYLAFRKKLIDGGMDPQKAHLKATALAAKGTQQSQQQPQKQKGFNESFADIRQIIREEIRGLLTEQDWNWSSETVDGKTTTKGKRPPAEVEGDAGLPPGFLEQWMRGEDDPIKWLAPDLAKDMGVDPALLQSFFQGGGEVDMSALQQHPEFKDLLKQLQQVQKKVPR